MTISRITEMEKQREQGWTLDKIGIFHGVSRERVRQLIGNTGNIGARNQVKGTMKHQISHAMQKGKFDHMTTSDVADKFGYSPKTVTSMWHGKRHAVLEGSLTHFGYHVEEWVSDVLKSEGFHNKLTNSRGDADIILYNGLKIEVKSRRTTTDCFSDNFYFFPLERSLKKGTADFFILVIWADDPGVFVIPVQDIPDHGGVGFTFPPSPRATSEWALYQNRFDLLEV